MKFMTALSAIHTSYKIYFKMFNNVDLKLVKRNLEVKITERSLITKLLSESSFAQLNNHFRFS